MDIEKLKELTERRKKVAEDLRHIKEGGDISENVAYGAALEELTKIDNEIIRLRNQKDTSSHVLMGCAVELMNLDTKKTEKYEVVADKEVNPLKGKISPNAPLVAALEEKKAGDEFEVALGNRTLRYKVIKISGSRS